MYENGIKYYLIYIGMHLQMILKKSICLYIEEKQQQFRQWILKQFILKADIAMKFCGVSTTHTNACLVLLFLS